MLVKDFLKNRNRDVFTATASMIIPDAMELLVSNRIGCLPVINENGKTIGIISDRDIFRAVYKDNNGFKNLKVGDLMTTHLIIGVPDDDLGYIGGVMTKNHIRHIPIVDNDRLVGLVSVGDVVKSHIDTIEVENRYLKTYISGDYPG
ncbi:MAG: CBS domain-containing protein [candidate division Zixibacteria bacterium]